MSTDPFARLQDLLAQGEQMVASQRPELERDAADRAEAAREGEHGPDWQRLQRRIDTGRTRLEDVVGGADDSPEAQAVRRTARERAATLAEDGADRPPEVVAALADLDAARARHAADQP